MQRVNSLDPAMAAIIQVMNQISPVTPEGTPTVAAEVLNAASQMGATQMSPSVGQAAGQAGLAAQLEAMKIQQAQQALMNQAMQGVAGLNPGISGFAEGGIIGYAEAGMAEDENMIIEPSDGGGEMVVEPSAPSAAPAARPETGIAGLAVSSAPAIADMRRVVEEMAKIPVSADPRKAMEAGILRRQVANEFARATGNDPDMIANQISQMEDFYRRRDQQLEQRYQEASERKEKGSLAQALMSFRQMKGRPIGEGFVSASRGLSEFQGGLDKQMRDVEDLRIQLEGLKTEKINSLKTLKYNTDMGFMNEAMKEQQRLIDNDRNIKKTEFEIAKKVAEIQSGEARTAAQIKERMERPTKAQNVYVKSTYTNAQGQRVAVMSDGSEKTLGSTLEVNNRIATLIANQEKANVQFRKLPEEDKKKWATERLALGEVTPAPAPAPAQVARPTTQAEFDALPKGTRYINPADGKEYAKN